MNKCAAILLAPGFEEAEAIIVIDILKRSKINVTTLACNFERELKSYHDVTLKADDLLLNKSETLFDAVIIPGGPQGSQILSRDKEALDFIRKHDEAQKYICPICSAAAKVLAPNKLLKGRRYVCSGALSEDVTDGVYVNAPVVQDGNLVSGQGLGAAFDFSFYLSFLLTQDKNRIIRQAEHIKHHLTLF